MNLENVKSAWKWVTSELTIPRVIGSGSNFDAGDDSAGNYFSKTRLKLRFIGDFGL
jgi:hypothetical protein